MTTRSAEFNSVGSKPHRVGGMPLAVRRLGNSVGPITVTCTTRDGSAKAGEDYVATQVTITFAPGEVEKVIQVPPRLGGKVAEPDKVFQLVLTSSELSGVVLNPPYSIIIHGAVPLLQLDAESRLTKGGVQVAALDGEIEKSQDLVHWTRLDMASRYVDSDGLEWRLFTDPPPTQSRGFYRAVRE